jgi:hypothetical protein
MSDNWLTFVPCDPNFQASQEAIAVALSLLRQFAPTTEEITARGDGSVDFYHAGANAETISCPSCAANLRECWIAAMDEAWQSRFEDLSVVTPCCQTATSLNDLNYDAPMAFGRFALELFNPRTKIEDEQQKQLEQILGTPLKEVWRRSINLGVATRP